ncbi:hypothetical protein GCM10009639_55670 [Kitasatospora putterlickiae]|uniref:Uncharacterized protein n=1 Tax=Kitasatospora putterlickiae TaxID=221725 RepID=A0ABN1YE79_9ACTN
MVASKSLTPCATPFSVSATSATDIGVARLKLWETDMAGIRSDALRVDVQDVALPVDHRGLVRALRC